MSVDTTKKANVRTFARNNFFEYHELRFNWNVFRLKVTAYCTQILKEDKRFEGLAISIVPYRGVAGCDLEALAVLNILPASDAELLIQELLGMLKDACKQIGQPITATQSTISLLIDDIKYTLIPAFRETDLYLVAHESRSPELETNGFHLVFYGELGVPYEELAQLCKVLTYEWNIAHRSDNTAHLPPSAFDQLCMRHSTLEDVLKDWIHDEEITSLLVLDVDRQKSSKWINDLLKICHNEERLIMRANRAWNQIKLDHLSKKPKSIPRPKKLTYFEAAMFEDINQLKHYLEVEKQDINAQDITGKGALHYAASCHQVGALEYLLRNKADPNLVDAYGDTPFVCAEQQTDRICCFLLMCYGARGTSKYGWIQGLDAAACLTFPVAIPAGVERAVRCYIRLANGVSVKVFPVASQAPTTVSVLQTEELNITVEIVDDATWEEIKLVPQWGLWKRGHGMFACSPNIDLWKRSHSRIQAYVEQKRSEWLKIHPSIVSVAVDAFPEEISNYLTKKEEWIKSRRTGPPPLKPATDKCIVFMATEEIQPEVSKEYPFEVEVVKLREIGTPFTMHELGSGASKGTKQSTIQKSIQPPLESGCCIGSTFAGTLGMLVKKNEHTHALSNAHVLQGNDPVYQVAHATMWEIAERNAVEVQFHSKADCAVARLNPNSPYLHGIEWNAQRLDIYDYFDPTKGQDVQFKGNKHSGLGRIHTIVQSRTVSVETVTGQIVNTLFEDYVVIQSNHEVDCGDSGMIITTEPNSGEVDALVLASHCTPLKGGMWVIWGAKLSNVKRILGLDLDFHQPVVQNNNNNVTTITPTTNSAAPILDNNNATPVSNSNNQPTLPPPVEMAVDPGSQPDSQENLNPVQDMDLEQKDHKSDVNDESIQNQSSSCVEVSTLQPSISANE